MSKSKLQRARVLADVAVHELLCGQVLEASPALITALAASGQVDPHRDAVGYALEQGAEVVRSRLELAQEAAQARQAELLAAVKAAEEKHAAAAEGEAKAAALAELVAAHDALKAVSA